jgi:hypothetical protein
MLAPVLIRKLTLCFSIVSITQGSSAFMVVTGAWMGGPETIIGWEPKTMCLGFPSKWGMFLEMDSFRGTPS